MNLLSYAEHLNNLMVSELEFWRGIAQLEAGDATWACITKLLSRELMLCMIPCIRSLPPPTKEPNHWNSPLFGQCCPEPSFLALVCLIVQ